MEDRKSIENGVMEGRPMIRSILDLRSIFDFRSSIIDVSMACALVLPLAAQVQTAQPTASSALIRVCVMPAADSGARDFAQSARDLEAAFQLKKKEFVIVATDDRPDVTITVTDRSTTTPKFTIGVVQNGRSSGAAAGPIRITHLTVTLGAKDTDDIELKNKNSPQQSMGGWESAADDVAKQIEKWITAHKSELIAKR
jgi:hypothetical protein